VRWPWFCLCDTIAHEFHPDKIVLFGSYAYGQAHSDSDADLLVMPFEGRPFRQAAHLPWGLPARRFLSSLPPNLTYAVLLARHLYCHCS
jgi:hypothetical protein